MMSPPRILLIEDSVGDIELSRRALRLTTLRFNLRAVQTANAGLEAARTEGADLILLDLNLAGAHGLDVLKALQDDDQTRGIPVVVVTTSAAPGDAAAVLAAGARECLTKPTSVRAFAKWLASALWTYCGHILSSGESAANG